MRKIRNPRYAPEFLERKMSPSAAYPAALVGSLSPAPVVYCVTSDEPPPPPPELDPILPPSGPSGPDWVYEAYRSAV